MQLTQIRAMPTVLAFHNGVLKQMVVGLLPEPKLKEFLKAI